MRTMAWMTGLLKRAGIGPDGEKLPKVTELGTCDWCSKVVYSDQEHETGRDDVGLMHTHLTDCEEDGK